MENKSPLVLTIDFGTQSVRTALINKQGEIEALIKRKYDCQRVYSANQRGRYLLEYGGEGRFD